MEYLKHRMDEFRAGTDALRADLEERRAGNVENADAHDDWRGCKSVGEMDKAQFSAWVDAGSPPLAADVRASVPFDRQQRAVLADAADAALARQIEDRITARLTSFAEMLGQEIGEAEKELRAEIKTLRGDVDALRGELKAACAELVLSRAIASRPVTPLLGRAWDA